MRQLFETMIVALVLTVLCGLARAERAMPPERLTIGYEEEGKVDASPQACLATVKEITEWNAAETQRGAREVCAARKKHVDAYQALQAAYKTFIGTVMKDRRFDWAEAASTIPALVKTCIAHKFSITTGGHNIGIDIINNEIATACLNLAANLLRQETKQLAGR